MAPKLATNVLAKVPNIGKKMNEFLAHLALLVRELTKIALSPNQLHKWHHEQAGRGTWLVRAPRAWKYHRSAPRGTELPSFRPSFLENRKPCYT